eukprot:4156802-Pyramimonas_sp.AAC.1
MAAIGCGREGNAHGLHPRVRPEQASSADSSQKGYPTRPQAPQLTNNCAHITSDETRRAERDEVDDPVA